MHKCIVPIIILSIVCSKAFGQSITLSGTLIDKTEKKPVENVVIALLRPKDSVLYKFTRTDVNGNFSLTNIKAGNYRLLTTHSLYADYVDSIALSTAEIKLGSIALLNKSKLLEEVIIKSGSPIRIKGDTTVYTADSFKVRDGASVEELLRKMPGFQVGKDGQLKAQGETVKNVLVDGEEFFGNDPGMVLKNLQANAVQEVQVYDKKSDQAAFTGIDDGTREKTVNLKLKANKKQGYFGKAEVAGGTPDNYNNSFMLNAFQGKRKISGYGFMSNTGRTGLGWGDGDKYGGSATSLGITSDGNAWSGNDYEDNNSNGRSGIPKNWNTGLHYSNKYKGDSLNINGSYRYSKIDVPGFNQTFSKIFLPDSSWANNSNSTSFSKSEKQDMNFFIERKIDSNNTIKFSTKGSINNTQSNNNYYEENLTNDSSFLNNSTRRSGNNEKRIDYQGSLLWSHKFKKNRRTFVALVNETINQSDGKTQLFALNNFYKGAFIVNKDTIDQKTLNQSNSSAFAANLIYTEPLTKYLSLGFNSITTISNSTNDKNVFKKDGTAQYNAKIDSLSNDFDYNRFTQRNGVSLRLVKKKITAAIGTAVAFNNFKQNNNSTGVKQDYNFTNFFPTANFYLTLKGNKRIRFNYYGNTDAPSLEQLQPIFDNSDPLNIAVGNVNLKQSFTHNFSGGFQWFKPLSENSVWSYFNYSTTNNAFTEFNRIDSLGRNIYQVVNVNGNKNLSGNIEYNFSVGSGKKKIGLAIELSTDFNRNIDYVNAIKNTNNNFTYSGGLSVRKYVEDKYDFYVGSNFGITRSTSSINTSSNRNYWTFKGDAQGSLYITKKLSINSNANFNFRQKDPAFPQNNNYIRWNADVRKYIYKKEFSIKFGINDILNQNRGYDRNFSTYKFTETYYNTLKRYWLLTFTWEFTHNKKIAAASSNNTTTTPLKK